MNANSEITSGRYKGPGWSKALNQEEHDKQLAAAWHYLRKVKLDITLAEAERRSGVCRQFWSKVESGESLPSGHTEVAMANALRVRPSVIHRLAERWVQRDSKNSDS